MEAFLLRLAEHPPYYRRSCSSLLVLRVGLVERASPISKRASFGMMMPPSPITAD